VLPRWGRRQSDAVAAYQRCVREGVKEGHRADVYEVVDQRYLGDEAFVQDVTGRFKHEEPPHAVAVTWEEIGTGVLQQCGVSAGAVMDRGKERGAVRIKRVMAWVGREVGGLKNREMAQALRQDPGSLSRGVRKLADEMDLVRIMMDADVEAGGLPAPGKGTRCLTDGRLAWLQRASWTAAKRGDDKQSLVGETVCLGMPRLW